MSDRDCSHGQLARSCRICELEAEVAELKRQLAERDTVIAGARAEFEAMQNVSSQVGKDFCFEAGLALLSGTPESKGA